MRTPLTEVLTQYAQYHRDRCNIATHFIGIPMIVLAVMILLSLPAVDISGLSISPATVAAIGATIYYIRLDLRFGLTMGVFFGLCHVVGQWFASGPSEVWLAGAAGLFVVGWIFQFIGHYFEGRRPAFVDDVSSLLIGPLFIVAEAAIMLGLRDDVRRALEDR